ncbi:ATP-dependent helicase [Kribbella sp. NPDC000426]|uniref:ATP-dependent helicase n=1 Tax=Kribbella sp. NPDC000426 TaxID=3154255 RepID=UPI00332F459F
MKTAVTGSDPSQKFRLPRLLADDIQEMDQEQQAAVIAPGNLVIIAGPGSGKTRTLVARAGYLLSTTISPFRGLAAITYTNQAALELQQRLSRLGILQPRRLVAGTVHSFCLSQVLPYADLVDVKVPPAGALMSKQQSDGLRDECAAAAHTDKWALKKVFPSLRRRFAAGEDLTDENPNHMAAVQRYERECDRLSIWDFDGVVFKAVALLREHPEVSSVVQAKFPVVLVDEYQDLGAALHRLVETLVDADVEVTAVGDADQSMFEFAGGDPRYLYALSERCDFETIPLKTNYRCGSAVIAAAEVALAESRDWRADPSRADPGTIEIRTASGDSNAQARDVVTAVLEFLAAGVPAHEIAVLLRFREPLAPLIRDGLAAADVQVRLEDTPTSPRSPLGKWLSSCALYAMQIGQWAGTAAVVRPSPDAAEALLGQLERFRSQAGHGRSAAPYLERLHALHSILTEFSGDAPPDLPTWARQVVEDLELVELARQLGDERNKDEIEALVNMPAGQPVSDFADDLLSTGRVTIGTYHGAKGRTFSAVILPALTEGVVPVWALDYGRPVPPPAATVAEERRYFYVALTRSRGSVLLFASTEGVDNRNKPRKDGYSRFARELAGLLGVQLP